LKQRQITSNEELLLEECRLDAVVLKKNRIHPSSVRF
jgi:hypothetical protein